MTAVWCVQLCAIFVWCVGGVFVYGVCDVAYVWCVCMCDVVYVWCVCMYNVVYVW